MSNSKTLQSQSLPACRQWSIFRGLVLKNYLSTVYRGLMEVWACFVCFQARDAFFRCVEADAGHTTPTEVASVGLLYPSQCKTLRANYEQLCRSTWVFPQSCLEFGFALPNHYTHWSTNLFIVFFGNCLSCDGMRWLRHWYLQICVDSLLKRRYHSQAYHWGDGSILQWFCSIWVNGWYGAGEAFWPSVLCKEKDQAVIGYRYWSATYFITTEDNHWASTRW